MAEGKSGNYNPSTTILKPGAEKAAKFFRGIPDASRRRAHPAREAIQEVVTEFRGQTLESSRRRSGFPVRRRELGNPFAGGSMLRFPGRPPSSRLLSKRFPRLQRLSDTLTTMQEPNCSPDVGKQGGQAASRLVQ